MFGTIRKHSTWLWVLIILFVSISMVVFFSPDGAIFGRSSAGGDYGSINGRPIPAAQYADAFKEVRLTEFLQSGKWPDNDEGAARRLENQAISRIFLLGKVKEMDIKASDKAAAMMVQEQLRDYPYDRFENEMLKPNGLKITDYERLVRNDAAIRQLVAAASVGARLVTSAEAEVLWRKENQEVSGQVATFWASNYASQVTVTNGAIGSFYTNRMGMYRLPERLAISYIEFPASNYLSAADASMAKLTNLNDIVSEYYFRGPGGTNRWTDTNGVAMTEAAAKEKIKEDFRLNEALLAARRAATELGNELIAKPDANNVANFDKLAAAKGLQVKTTQPFDRVTGLDEFTHEQSPVPDSEEAPRQDFKDIFRERAFSLTPEKPILFNPLIGRHAVYVIARKNVIPSEQQPLDKITDKVTTDYKNFMALSLARTAGQAFHTNLTNGLASKKSFAEIAAASKVTVIDLPPFSSTTRSLTNVDSRINLRLLQNLASNLEPGGVSPFVSAQPPSEGGFVFHLKSRPPIDVAKMNAELPTFIGQMRLYRQNEAFQQWFRKQAELAKLSGPKREEPAPGSAGTPVGAPN